MTKAQEALVEKIRKALFDDPKIPSGAYVTYSLYLTRGEIVDGLVALFEAEED